MLAGGSLVSSTVWPSPVSGGGKASSWRARLPEPNLLTVTALFAVLGLACGYPSLLAAHTRAMVPDRLVGRGQATVNKGVMVAIAGMLFAVGAIIDTFPPTAGGTIAPETFRVAFGFLSVMAIITFSLYLRSIDA